MATKVVTAKSKRLHWPIVWTVVVAALVYWGMHAHLERYVTPQRGLGYWLGISGGSMMLLLLIYSARKRYAWLRWLGGIPAWFEIHMTLGVVGPILVLFHANFHLGATNSNVALTCMLVVAGSGVIGRYIYTRLHAHMDGNEDTLEQLKAVGERLRSQRTSISFLPGLLDAIDSIERRLIEPPQGRVKRLFQLLTGGPRLVMARWQVRREIDLAVERALMQESAVIARHAQRIAQVARRYAERRLEAGRRVAEYQIYAKLFSFWHVLHIPLFFMLLIAGIVHVIAINVY
ncbi:MAG: pyridine nucleotide-disulfide oxidoreductase [Steroidobacteraceae bacterium]